MRIGLGLSIPGVAVRSRAKPNVFPWPGAAVDFDFVRRRYWWGGAEKLEANFTTFVLNGAVFEARGLNVSAGGTVDITVTFATLGITVPPMALGFAGYVLSNPSAAKSFVQFDNGTTAERVIVQALAGPFINCQLVDNSASVASINGAGTGVLNVLHGIGCSAQTNEVLLSANGVPGTADLSCTMPTPTLLRIGKAIAASSNPDGIISRLVVFVATKTQAELNTLSTEIRA